jgi:hypothetical protein
MAEGIFFVPADANGAEGSESLAYFFGPVFDDVVFKELFPVSVF